MPMPLLPTRPARVRFAALHADASATNRTAQDVVLATLRAAIGSGLFGPGTRLRQEELADLFGTSRIPVREALKALEHEGLLASEPHRGFTVRGLDADDIDELFELRAMLDGSLVARAVLLMDEGELDALASLLEAAEGASGDDRAAALETFWEQLFGAAGRPRTAEITGRLRRDVRRAGAAAIDTAPARAVLERMRDGQVEEAVAALVAGHQRSAARLRRDRRSPAAGS